MNVKTLTTSLLVAAALCACSSKPTDTWSKDDPVTHPKAYALGQKRASEAAECGSREELEDLLLDTQARITEISQRNGREAARDYRRGFEETILASGDSLASALGIRPRK